MLGVACTAVAGVSALAVPTLARADDGAGAASVPGVVEMPGLEAATRAAEALTGEADPLDVVSEIVAEALPEEAPAAADEPAATPEDAASQAVPSPGAPENMSQNADTTASQPDTTADTAAVAPTATATASTASAAPVIEVSPKELRVSVRVDGPGDSTPVPKLEIAGATAVGAASEAPAVRSPAAAPAGTSSPTPGSAGAAVSPTDEAAISLAGIEDVWGWALDVTSSSGMSFSGSIPESMPTTWTLLWNSVENFSRYQAETALQYQPINVDAAIRLASFEDDGPLTQTIVGIALGAGHGAALMATPPEPAGAGSAAQTAPTRGTAAEQSPVIAPAAASPQPSTGPGSPSENGPPRRSLGAPAGHQIGGEADAGPRLRPGSFREGSTRAVAPRTGWWPRQGALAESTATSPTTETVAAARAERAASAPRSREPAPTRQQRPSAPVGASASAAAGSGSSGGGLPIFLALPLLAAVLDLARRAALERVAWPSGHPARIPDTPG